MAKLKVERGATEGTAYFIEDEAVLGQDPARATVPIPESGMSRVTIQIPDSKVSRAHARIFQKGNGYFLEDLRSKNGTFLNGRPLTGPEPLQPGDYFLIGCTWFSFGEDMEIEKIRGELRDSYEIQEEITHAGRIGLCFKVRQVGLDRIVTLNLLPPSIVRNKPQLSQRFQLEAKSLAQLCHENIAIMLDFEANASYLYLTTEYVEGEPLSTLLAREKRLSLTYGLEIGIAVAKALAHAHSQKVTHQGLTSRSVILSGRRVILGGFGVAAVLSEVQDQFSGLVSRLEYLSPEQIKKQKVDFRCDIYSLGVLLYEIFSGRPPFKGDTVEAISDAHLNDEPVAITSYNSEVPSEIESVIYQCLEKEPAQRIQGCEEIANRLEQVYIRRKILELRHAPHIYTSWLMHHVVQLIGRCFLVWLLPLFALFVLSLVALISGLDL